MGTAIRISLPGKDCFKTVDPNDYSLFADQDNVLLKEFHRGTLSIGGSYAHNLGYYPLFFAYGDIGSGKYQLATGWDAVSGVPRTNTTTTTLQSAGAAIKYFIFYDDIAT